MKKKFSRILGVAVTLALVASLFGFAIPVAAQPGNMQWAGQPLPTVNYFVMDAGSDVVDIAVASDGQTIYACTGLNMNIGLAPTAAGPPWALYKSADAGQSWAAIDLSAVTPMVTAPVVNVAVAPDNPDAVAISVRDTGTAFLDRVYISNTGGATWAQLPTLGGNSSSVNAAIMDLDVAPARAGTVMGREYVVAIADETAGAIALGDVQIIGGIATWATVAATVDGLADYMAARFTPNFVGDRSVVTVCADTVTGSFLHIINTFTSTERRARVVLSPVANLATDYDVLGVAADSILAADIALPSNFDPTTVAGERSYACTSNVSVADDDVWRVDAGIAWALGLASTAWQSVAYNGTTATGILLAGARAAPTGAGLDMGPAVRYTAEMTTSAPVWTFSLKAPTGMGGRALLRVAADYATTERIFAGTSGIPGAANDESAFSVSNNAGVSFEQEALIDIRGGVNNVVNTDTIALTPDGSTLYIATNDANSLSVWKSDTPLTWTSWSRVVCADMAAGSAGGMMALNPLWDDVPAIYLADVVANGNVYVSTDGGYVWNTRMGPGLAPSFMTLQDAETAYISNAALVYKSTSSAWTWPYAPANAQAGVIVSMQAPLTDQLLVGGAAACSYSTDGATTFTPIPVGLTAGDTLAILADEGYAVSGDAGENLIYAGDTSGTTNNIYRFTIGTSSAWEAMRNTGVAAMVGVAMNNGAVYGVNANVADRCLNPHAAVGEDTWREMDVPDTNADGITDLFAANAPASFTAVDNKLYVASALDDLYGYDDYLAVTKPVITSPPDGYPVSIDPTTGNGELTYLSWDAMGSETGLVSSCQVLVWETALGMGSAAVYPTPITGTALIVPTAPQVDTGTLTWTLLANTEYTLLLRGFDQVSGDALVTQWSDPLTLSVQAGGLVTAPHEGPILLGPAAGATNVSVTPGFSWTPIHGATEYEFILATDSALTQTVEGTPVYVSEPAWQVPPTTLEYDTAYFWAAKATKPVESVQGVGSFHTMRAPTVFTCPICGETFDTETELSSHMDLEHPAELVTPGYIWGIIGIGAILVIVVLVLIVRTRRSV